MDSAQYQSLSRELHARYPGGGRSDALGLAIVGVVLGMTAAALWVSSSSSPVLWLLGQCWLALCILQAFILVHDLGHGCFFKTRALNDVMGTIVSAIVILPFYPWRYVHADHHTWTGWQDKDPTMSQIRPRDLPRALRAVADFCWRWWIPVFALAFSFGAFWSLPKLFRRWKKPGVRVRLLFSVVLLVGLFGAILALWPSRFLRLYGLAYILYLMVADPLLLSQHSHVPQRSSGGEKVQPVPFYEQDQFTRSLDFPRPVSKWVLLYFDRHGIHHFFPNLPLYRLGSVEAPVANRIGGWTWLKTAKGVPVHRLLLENRDQTGVWL